MNNKRLIAKIFNGEDVVMTIDKNMLSCEFGALDRGNLTDIVNWGIYANRGSISFVDNIGFFNNQNVNSVEVKGYTVRFYLTKEQQTLIATFNIDDVDFEEETRKVNISVVSPLLKLQTEKTNKNIYPFHEANLSALVLYINDFFPNSNFSIGEGDFTNITIGCPYISVDTVWNIMTKICQAAMSRVVETPNGDFEITSSFQQRTPIIVNPNNIISCEKADFVIIKNPNIIITERQKHLNKVLDASKNSFYIDWDIEKTNVNILDSTGITLSDIEKQTSGNGETFYATGKIIIKTPYKIFSVSRDNSSYNIRYVYFSNSTDEYPSLDTKTTSLGVLLDTPSIENEQNIVANLKRRAIYDTFATVSGSNNGYKQFFFSDGTFSFPITTFEDNGTYIHTHHKADVAGDEIESNDLIQNISYYEKNDGNKVPLGSHIVDEVYKRYHNGIECFEIECLFNDYYDENGNKVFNKDDLSVHFNKYDIIIPYVMKKGQTVALRTNEDGTPKKFRVIGISYSYDGLLKQKLSIQEERYDID